MLARLLSRLEMPTRRTIAQHAPWLSASARSRAITNNDDINDDAVNIAITNGHYLELALKNESHFTPLNWDTFEKYQREAFTAIQNHFTTPISSTRNSPIPAEAVGIAAFGLHFLTDAFSSGHMRVPRKELGAAGMMGAKIMHDIDNRYGLLVKDGFSNIWRAYGDGFLIPGNPPREEDQRNIIDLINKDPNFANSGINLDPSANYDAIVFAVGSALKQLHYEAQRLGKLNPNSQYKQALEQNMPGPTRTTWRGTT